MPASLRSFTDAAADVVAREIASLRREAQRERDVREAEHRARLAELDARVEAARRVENDIAQRLASLRDGVDGEPGRDGVDGKDGAPGERGTDGLPGRDGVDGAPGRDGADGRDGERGLDGAAGRDGVDGAPGERGPEGPAGKLPIVRDWQDQVHYEGNVVNYAGACWQALRDTGREPPHSDWQLIAAAGRDGANGADGRSFVHRGTWIEVNSYSAMDVVALGGSSFVAKRDDPGPCPGEGWQLMASKGSRGPQGERGVPGERGPAGADGTFPIAFALDGETNLVITLSDGTELTCDLYPILSRLA